MRAEDMRRAFSANVSHEMKTPLQVIAGYSELLSTGMVPAEDTVKFAGIIHEESQHMYALIDDVLALSRLDEPVSPDGLSDSIDLRALAENVAERLRPLAEKYEVSLRVEGLDGQRVLIDGNEPLMEQVMTNLVSNAIRYNRPGGEVVVAVDTESTPAVLERCDKEAGVDELRFGPRSHVAARSTSCRQSCGSWIRALAFHLMNSRRSSSVSTELIRAAPKKRVVPVWGLRS